MRLRRYAPTLVISTVIITIGLGILWVMAGAIDRGSAGFTNFPSPKPFDPQADAPDEVLARSNRALLAFQGYSITVSATNFVLPQWGGSDSGSVWVGNSPAVAEVGLFRTGDGSYAMLYGDGQTFFARDTCDHFARVPGGGRETMLPFLWGETKALQNATSPRFIRLWTNGVLEIEADIQYLGPVSLDLDPATYLPLQMRKPADAAGGEVVWRFSDWGEAPEVEKPAGDIPDQGPGGNPC